MSALKLKTPLKIDPAKSSLTLVIPAYNEEATIRLILEKILKVPMDRPLEIVVVNDGSKDGTEDLVLGFQSRNPQLDLTYLKKENGGKGSAVRMGILAAKNDYILIQDADLEYDPFDYPKILEVMDSGKSVVYGSRNLNQKKNKKSSTLFYWGGILVTWWTNCLYGSRLTDEATCYKCFRRSIFQNLQFQADGFGWEPEITAKILKARMTISEVPISYDPRSSLEGKKISWKDGVKALWILSYERFRP